MQATAAVGRKMPTGSPNQIAQSACVDRHDLAEQLDCLVVRTLERVASDDRAETAAIMDALDLRQQLLVAHGRAAGEDHDALAIERTLHHVADAFRERLDRNFR